MRRLSTKNVSISWLAALSVAVLLLGFTLLFGFAVGVVAHRSGVLRTIKVSVVSVFDTDKQAAIYREPDLPNELVTDTRSLGYEPSKIQTRDQFLVWRVRILNEAERLLAVDWCCEQQVRVPEEIVQKGGYTQQRVVLESLDDEIDIVFYRLIPDSVARQGDHLTPGVLVIPGSGIGVTGVLNKGLDYQQGIAAHLTEAGYVVYAVENLGWGERTIDSGTDHSGYIPAYALGINSVLLGRPLASRYVFDARRVLEVLLSDKLVDAHNVAVIGCSLGGNIAAFTSALGGDRVTATVLCSGLFSFFAVPDASQFIVPGMLGYFDSVDIAATIAARPLLLTWGEQDPSPNRVEYSSSTAYQRLLPAYEVTGALQNLRLDLHSGGHGYDIEGTVAFLDGHLK